MSRERQNTRYWLTHKGLVALILAQQPDQTDEGETVTKCYLCGEDRAPDCDDGQDHCRSCRTGCPICGPEDHRWDEADRAWSERKEGGW